MNSFRAARLALRARPAATFPGRRTYAQAAGPSDKIRLSLSVPHQAIYQSTDVLQVNIPAATGDMGILANHVPAVEQLKPGVIEIIEDGAQASKQYFVSGGFAVVQPNSHLSINAVELASLDEFSVDAVRANLAESQKVANGSGSEADIAEAKIEVEVLETLAAALK